jgi:hypothetical protein
LQIGLESQNYSNKALELSKKVGDDWLISRSYQSAWSVAQMLHWDPFTAIETGENMLKHGKITKDNYLIGFGLCLEGLSINVLATSMEDPDKQKESYEKSLEMLQQASHNLHTINNIGGLWLNFVYYIDPLIELALIETDTKKRQRLFENDLKAGNYVLVN